MRGKKAKQIMRLLNKHADGFDTPGYIRDPEKGQIVIVGWRRWYQDIKRTVRYMRLSERELDLFIERYIYGSKGRPKTT